MASHLGGTGYHHAWPRQPAPPPTLPAPLTIAQHETQAADVSALSLSQHRLLLGRLLREYPAVVNAVAGHTLGLHLEAPHPLNAPAPARQPMGSDEDEDDDETGRTAQPRGKRRRKSAPSDGRKPRAKRPKAHGARTPGVDCWTARFEELRRYKEANGHMDLHWKKDKVLYRWCDNQRQAMKRSQKGQPTWLNPERIGLLDGIGFEWDISKGEQKKDWDQWLSELSAYRDRFGTFQDVPVSGEHGNVGRKIQSLRMEFRAGALSDERIASLDGIGFEFENKSAPAKPVRFEERLEALKRFKSEHGHFHPSMSLKDNPYQDLGRWAYGVRRMYRLRLEGAPAYEKDENGKKRLTISDEHIAALSLIGFDWAHRYSNGGISPKLTWEKRLEQLREYKEKFGTCVVSERSADAGDDVDGEDFKSNRQLLRWVQNQRVELKRFQGGKTTRMTEERAAKLREVGFDEEFLNTRMKVKPPKVKPAKPKARRRNAWESRLEQLREYKEKFGTCVVTERPADADGDGEDPNSNKQLLRWVQNQKVEVKRLREGKSSKLTEERAAKLREVGFDEEFLKSRMKAKPSKEKGAKAKATRKEEGGKKKEKKKKK